MVKATRADMVKESEMKKERAKAKPRTKDSQKFEEVLKERAQQLQQPSIMRQQSMSQTATEHAVKHRESEEDRGRDKGRDKGEEKEGRKGDEGDRKTDAKIAEQRVVAKHSTKEHGGRGGGKGGKGGSFEGRRGVATRSKAEGLKQAPAHLRAQFANKLVQAAKQPSRALTQQVLNQIVQYVRIGINSNDEKEILVDLHERIFKGLKLRVATKGKGKVTVNFTTADSEVRSLFLANRGDIRDALERSGIDVDEITVA